MELDLDTFLTTIYCIADDLYRAEFAAQKPLRPGPTPKLSDSEVITLALLAQWQRNRSERAFLRYAQNHWRSYFPKFLSQSAFNRRMRDLAGVICQLGPAIAAQTAKSLGVASVFEVLDGVAAPLMKRCRGRRHRLFADDEAAFGWGGSDRDWYYGVQMLAAVNDIGMITGFVFGPANTEIHWLAEALLRWRRYPEAPQPTAAELASILGPSHKMGGRRLGPTGPIRSGGGVGRSADSSYLADRGLRGRKWGLHWRDDYGAVVLTKVDYDTIACPEERNRWQRWLGSLRQVVETVNNWLTNRFGLTYPKARTPWGLLARLGAKVAAFNAAIHINLLTNRETFAIFDPFE